MPGLVWKVQKAHHGPRPQPGEAQCYCYTVQGSATMDGVGLLRWIVAVPT